MQWRVLRSQERVPSVPIPSGGPCHIGSYSSMVLGPVPAVPAVLSFDFLIRKKEATRPMKGAKTGGNWRVLRRVLRTSPESEKWSGR
jgi:hypothetical protein